MIKLWGNFRYFPLRGGEYLVIDSQTGWRGTTCRRSFDLWWMSGYLNVFGAVN